MHEHEKERKEKYLKIGIFNWLIEKYDLYRKIIILYNEIPNFITHDRFGVSNFLI